MHAKHTNVVPCILIHCYVFARRGDEVIDIIRAVEVERLEGVEDEVSHVLVHIGVENSPIKIVNSTTAVHHLEERYMKKSKV